MTANPLISGWILTPLGWILGAFANIFIHYADLLSFMLITDWETSQEATNYENAAIAANQDPNNTQARIDQENAFQNLFG